MPVLPYEACFALGKGLRILVTASSCPSCPPAFLMLCLMKPLAPGKGFQTLVRAPSCPLSIATMFSNSTSATCYFALCAFNTSTFYFARRAFEISKCSSALRALNARLSPKCGVGCIRKCAVPTKLSRLSCSDQVVPTKLFRPHQCTIHV